MMVHVPAGPVQAAIQVALADAALKDAKVAGADRTDFILSAEIMAIALDYHGHGPHDASVGALGGRCPDYGWRVWHGRADGEGR